MKIVINKCFGGFSVSEEVYKEMGFDWDKHGYRFSDDRTNPDLVKAVEKLGRTANGRLADLKVVEIPDGVEYTIQEYDGIEHIAEAHRTWG